ncbi:unnamed protein product, partial [Iphiclides podalirius]
MYHTAEALFTCGLGFVPKPALSVVVVIENVTLTAETCDISTDILTDYFGPFLWKWARMPPLSRQGTNWDDVYVSGIRRQSRHVK